MCWAPNFLAEDIQRQAALSASTAPGSTGQVHGCEVFGPASAGKHAEVGQLGVVPFDYANKSWIAAMRQNGGVDGVFGPQAFLA
jgi:hypothetical protein